MRILLTGATGMVGKGVLFEALDDPETTEVLALGRTPVGFSHSKLKELLVTDFADLVPLQDKLAGYDACFFCMGVSAAGMPEKDYTRVTHDFTLATARAALAANPGLVFTYVSGAGTDSTEKGRAMWARVKGRTENALLAMPFRAAYMFRPGAILPERGITSRTGWYRAFYIVMKPFAGLMRRSDSVTTTSRMGHAMLEVAKATPTKRVLDPADINALAKAYLARRSGRA